MKRLRFLLLISFALSSLGFAGAEETPCLNAKLGVFHPSWHLRDIGKLNIGDYWPAVGVEYKLGPEKEPEFEMETVKPERIIGLEYTQKTGSRYQYQGNTYQDSGNILSATFIARWRASPIFYGFGVGLHRTYFEIENLSQATVSRDLRVKFGLYLLGGFNLTNNFFVEAKYHLLEEVGVTTTGGSVSGNGLYVYAGGAF